MQHTFSTPSFYISLCWNTNTKWSFYKPLEFSLSCLKAQFETEQTQTLSLYTASFQGQTKVKRAGHCCDECAAAKGSCLYEGTVRYNGDMWNGTDCEFCSCNRGQVLCQRAECGRVECPQVSLKEIKDGHLKPRGRPDLRSGHVDEFKVKISSREIFFVDRNRQINSLEKVWAGKASEKLKYIKCRGV